MNSFRDSVTIDPKTSGFISELIMKKLVLIFLLTISCSAMAEWIEYAAMPNGDVYYYDDARIEMDGSEIIIWTRVRYKTSVMAASSYQSLLRLDCAEISETVLQHTFYTDKNWNKPAMVTNTNAKPTQPVKGNSPTKNLISVFCKDS